MDKRTALANINAFRRTKLEGRRKILEDAISRAREGATLSQADAVIVRHHLGNEVHSITNALCALPKAG